MTRQIKFRAWDSKHNCFDKFIEDKTLAELGNGYYLSNNKHFIYQQFTGLLDKNEKEIYEGDIVLFEDTESEYVDVGVGGDGVKVAEQQVNSFFPVVYWNGMFGMEIEGSESFEDGFTTLHEVVESQDLTEIIGNIYEDPDLLSPKEDTTH